VRAHGDGEVHAKREARRIGGGAVEEVESGEKRGVRHINKKRRRASLKRANSDNRSRQLSRRQAEVVKEREQPTSPSERQRKPLDICEADKALNSDVSTAAKRRRYLHFDPGRGSIYISIRPFSRLYSEAPVSLPVCEPSVFASYNRSRTRRVGTAVGCAHSCLLQPLTSVRLRAHGEVVASPLCLA